MPYRPIAGVLAGQCGGIATARAGGVAIAARPGMDAEIRFAIETALRHAARARRRVSGLTFAGDALADELRAVLERQGLGDVHLTLEPSPGPLRLVAVELMR